MHYYVLGKLAVNNDIALLQVQKSLLDKYYIKEIIKFVVEKYCYNLLYSTAYLFTSKKKKYIKHTCSL